MKSTLSILFFLAAWAPLGFGAGYNKYDRLPPPPPCGVCPPCSASLGVGADFIWWHPCIDDLDFALSMDNDLGEESSGTSSGDYIYLKHDYQPGFRLFSYLKNASCYFDYRSSYTFIDDSKSKSASAPSGGSILSTLFHGGFNFSVDSLYAKHRYRYQTFDILLLYNGLRSPCQNLYPFAGVEGLSLERTLRCTLSNSTTGDSGNYEWKGKYKGIGLKAGADYFWGIDCAKFFIRASGSLLVGELEGRSQHSASLIEPPEGTHLKFRDCEWICTPGTYAAAGLRVDTGFCCGTYAEIGYEFVKWYNVPAIRRFYGSGQNIGLASSASGSSFGFHGLFAGLGILF